MRLVRARLVVTVGVALWLGAPIACSSSEEDDDGGEQGGSSGDAGGSQGGGAGAGEGGDAGRGGSARGGQGGSSRGGQGGSSTGGTAGDAGASTGGGGEGGNPCAHCDNDICLEDGSCVECTADEHCDGATPGCDMGDNVCVECTADEHCDGATPRCDAGDNVCVECLSNDDNCPNGEYCSDALVCVEGCKADGSSCASGSCLESRECERCIDDGECMGSRVCANGECTDPCEGEGMSCGAANTCCSMHCIDTTRTIDHCGGCSGSAPEFACENDEFCGSMGCADAIVANLCQNPGAVVMLDGLASNEAAGAVLGMALGACTPAPTLRSVEQDVLDVSNPMTGQPVVGPGELLLIAGGAFGQRVAEYFQNERVAPLRQVGVGDRYELHRSADDSFVAGTLQANANATHDIFFVQVVRDPASGTLAFNVGGFHASGTGAAAWYFQNVMMPMLSTFTKPWYVYEWTDGGANQMPDGSDTFTLLAEAP